MRTQDDVVYLEGPVTQVEAARLLAEGEAAVAAGCRVFDLQGVTKVDSVALSLLLAWRRRAAARAVALEYRNLPASLGSLVELYGVGDLLPS